MFAGICVENNCLKHFEFQKYYKKVTKSTSFAEQVAASVRILQLKCKKRNSWFNETKNMCVPLMKLACPLHVSKRNWILVRILDVFQSSHLARAASAWFAAYQFVRVLPSPLSLIHS